MQTSILKKGWAYFIVLAMLAAALLPAAAWAAGGTDAHANGLITLRGKDGREEYYNTLYEAAQAAEDGDIILLNDNIEMAFFELNGKRQKPTMTITAKDIILDGQGHTVTANQSEAFSMIEVREGGGLTVQNIVLDGSASSSRRYSNIIDVEGGEAVIEDGAVLTNNCTAAVDIGINVPGGKCVMNGGMITKNIMSAGSNDTGVAVTVLEESEFIMNGGIISYNRTEKYGSSGIMVNRGGRAVLNGGIIENNVTAVSGMGSAVHIKGGYVQLNGAEIKNNISAEGYGAVYVTNHSSFGVKWDGIFDINGGSIAGNKGSEGGSNAIYLYSRSNITDTGAYLYFSGSPKIQGPSLIYANTSPSVAFKPLKVDGQFNPLLPVEIDLQFEYIIKQSIVEYAENIKADSSHFIAVREDYGFQESEKNNLLYTEAKRKVIFMDGEDEIDELSYWEFVEDGIKEAQAGGAVKPGYRLEGWYTEPELTDKWDFAEDVIPREQGNFVLYAKWEAIEAQAPVLPDITEIELPCADSENPILRPEFQKEAGYEYIYEWKNSAGEIIGELETQAVSLPGLGQTEEYFLNITAKRLDNGQTAQSNAAYIVSRAQHSLLDMSFDENEHWRGCAVCGEKDYKEEHIFEWVIVREATSTQAGLKYEECSVCGYCREDVEIPPLSEDPGNTGDNFNYAALMLPAVISLAGVIFMRLKKSADNC